MVANAGPSSLSELAEPEFVRQEMAKVVIGGVTTGIAGMTIGSLLAVQKNLPATVPGLTMCIKTSSFGTAFFALRQFVVNPVLQINRVPTTSSSSTPHFHGLLSTGISAAMVGGSVNGYLRGRRVIGRSGLTTGLVCCTLQIVYNELGILRRMVFDSRSGEVKGGGPERPVAPAWWEAWIPLSKISDEEWKERLSVQLADNGLQLATLNQQISQLQNAISNHRKGPPANPS
ncbi:hypothetical protein PTTG_05092 [Puccinia triticina 1-1 BBBD Race 1]|uniref:Uncharacterized protein n=2 Tax=Puccinia triticina TaxID=208348 RepID=A0A0C4EWA2_PUCT1|nr:uncharacterized protein PtA15_17A350 [Puccinia triticina]OAV91475.1 hypothetical protein PTTG_05092 [Puccinia triticina 1-1 BBBD Race 1]WAQ92868.1 hypothetical protein PtA15_17A350 [Puccinia triticina]WAR63764.1 hypothetical protein PtB15_17B365 [Puccinia triticina]